MKMGKEMGGAGPRPCKQRDLEERGFSRWGKGGYSEVPQGLKPISLLLPLLQA
jgi:hypothetical protein